MQRAELCAALADDLDGLARLHDREIDRELVAALAAAGFPEQFALLPDAALRAAMHTAFAALRAPPAAASGGAPRGGQGNSGRPFVPLREKATNATGRPADAPGDVPADAPAVVHVDAAGDPLADSWSDVLAADFAAIYLTGACGASPCESVWLTEEGLTCQWPMFELRDIYARAGLAVDDWRRRHDDHFVLQFQYLARRLREDDADLAALGAFVDQHVGYWFDDFAGAVAARAGTDFYRVLALLTADWLARFRALIETATGVPRPPRERIEASIQRKAATAAGEQAPIHFFPGGRPGAGPSW